MQKKQAISYVRFSSARQKFGSSVERQEAMIAAWLTNNPDYEASELKYKDLGKSGSKGEHIKEGGNFAKLLLAVKEGRIRSGDVILVEAIDRTGRLPLMDMLTFIIAPILRAGVSIITLDDNVTYTEASANSTHVFLLVAKIQAAHDYSKSLGNRITDSYTLRRNAAKANGTTPKRMTPVWLNSDGSVREDVKPWIKLAFELYVSGMGKATIAQRMRESGVKRLAKCSGPGVEGWLRNKAVIGKWETLAGTPDHQIIDGVYPDIIEPALFYKAQIRAEKMKTQRPVKTAKHFLVVLVRCGTCGKSYIIQNKDGAPHSMRCRTRQQLRTCENSHIVPKPVMDTIYRYTAVRAADEAMAQQLMGVNEKEIITQEAKLLTLNKQFEHLVQMVKEFGLDDDNREAYRQAKAEREAAENALVILRSTATTPAANVWAKYWQEKYRVSDLERDDPQQLAAMLRTVDYAITVNADGRITSSHSDTVYRYAGVDRREDKYKLMCGDKLVLVSKASAVEYPDYESPEPDEPAELTQTDEEWDELQRQHE